MTAVQWDYTELARHYDKRPDYASAAIDELVKLARPDRARPVADIGAGTAKLTRPLLDRGFTVHAVEPNDAMREFGQANTAGRPATWTDGTGEKTGLAAKTYDLVTFGSSFNVTDRQATLLEVARILRAGGWFACMWNHRDLTDPLQARCEQTIVKLVPGYGHGTRREDQTEVIRASGLFEEPVAIERPVTHAISREDYMEAWRSHATLQRQAGEGFAGVIHAIEAELAGVETLQVPYMTRMWCARLKG